MCLKLRNFLQKTTFEQVERSQTTEDNFQKIRDVTGLADVPCLKTCVRIDSTLILGWVAHSQFS